MAYEKPGWKETLYAEKSKRRRSNDTTDPREKKKISKLMYQRRIIDKEIKQLLKQPVIRYG